MSTPNRRRMLMIAAAALAVVRPAPACVLEAGTGGSYFVTDTVALNVGYRFQHISNGYFK